MTVRNIITFILAITMAFQPAKTIAQVKGSGLVIAPTRLLFEGRTRSAELTLSNNGNETSTYRIQTVNSRMTENGKRENVESEPIEGELFADKLVRFAPRQVRLRPGEQQTIRVMARINKDLKEGEYRTGLNFQWVPDPASPDIREIASTAEKISVKIEFSFGITVPVIIRNGELKASGKISNLALKKDENHNKVIEVTIAREGNSSLYGDLSIFRNDASGKEELVYVTRGLAIYVPNPRRVFTMKLPMDKISSANPEKEKLRVEYREPQSSGGKLITEASIPLE